MHPYTTLIDAASLAALPDQQLALFDCRFELGDPAWGQAQYTQAHIPGAQYLHLERDLSGTITASSGRHPLPDPRAFAQRLGDLGAGPDAQLVAYDQGNGAYAARLWWLARWIGARRVAVLDGGMAAWRAAGLPLETVTRAPRQQVMPVEMDRGSALETSSIDELRLRPGNLLVDARSAERFAGRNESIDPVAGHVPGARSFPFAGNLGGDGKFLPADLLRRRFLTLLGSQPPAALISMCGSGVTACHNLLALEHAGLSGARLYAGSWSEWIREPGRPIATGTH
jgi:thiosulfate/3-mercaptopyruvate sulfurtransferase